MKKNVDNGLYPSYFNYLLTESLDISEAPEPTDIIWENRHNTYEQRKEKEYIVGVIIFILLLISAGFIFSISVKNRELKQKYPVSDCVQKQSMFIEHASEQEYSWEQLAFEEFIRNTKLQLEGKQSFYTDTLPCFCQYERLQKQPQSKNYTL